MKALVFFGFSMAGRSVGRLANSQVVSSTEYCPVASMITRAFLLGARSSNQARNVTTPWRVRGKDFQGSALTGVLGKRCSELARAASKVSFETSRPTQYSVDSSFHFVFFMLRSPCRKMRLPDHSYGIRALARDNLRSSMATAVEGRRAVSLGRASQGPWSRTTPPPLLFSHVDMRENTTTNGQSYPHHPHSEQKKKNQKEKNGYYVDSGDLNPCPESYKVAGSNPAPATI